MNPVLLKPEGDAKSQLVLMGKMSGNIHARQFLTRRERLWNAITESLATLQSQFDIIVIEGAGSPAEINLRKGDIVNMEVALHTNAPVFIIGDIDKGGVFASLYGTHQLISEQERDLVKGFIINKFRGDPSLLRSGIDDLRRLTEVDVVGVIPYLNDVYVPEEDSPMRAQTSNNAPQTNRVEIAVIALPHIANFDEFDPLARMDNVELRYVRTPTQFGNPDIVIIPGTKTTVADLEFIRRSEIETIIRSHILRGKTLIGICGGLQMLGKWVHDPDGIESDRSAVQGLGILDIQTEFLSSKKTNLTNARIVANQGILAGANGMNVSGYEIHVGASKAEQPPQQKQSNPSQTGNLLATSTQQAKFSEPTCTTSSKTTNSHNELSPTSPKPKVSTHRTNSNPSLKKQSFDKLADHLRKNLDMDQIYRCILD